MGSLGYVMTVPEEEKYLMSQSELEARLVMLLAGRAAEEIVFDSVTTGASNDMEKATKIAKSMIAMYGMSDKFGLMSLEQVENQYLGRKFPDHKKYRSKRKIRRSKENSYRKQRQAR